MGGEAGAAANVREVPGPHSAAPTTAFPPIPHLAQDGAEGRDAQALREALAQQPEEAPHEEVAEEARGADACSSSGSSSSSGRGRGDVGGRSTKTPSPPMHYR